MNRQEAVEKIGQHWDAYSCDFDQVHDTEDLNRWKQALAELIGTDTRKNVLDLGTGTGFLANMTGEMGYPTVGMDVSREMLRYAVRHSRDRKSGAVFLYGDVLELPFMDSCVDNVVNARLLWTLVEPENALREWIRVLRPGGKLMCFNRMKEGVGLTRYTEKPFYDDENIDQLLELQTASMEKLKALAERAGFTNVSLRQLPGLTRPGYDYEPWYVLYGEKPRTQQQITAESMEQYWNRRAESYEPDHALENRDAWNRAVEELLGEDKQASILDLAAGTGMLTILAASAGYHNITGSDISEGMMHVAIRNARQAGLEIPFVYANALELPWDDCSLNVVISMRLLWTLSEPERAIREWLRVLKPGGRLIAVNQLEAGGIPDFVKGQNGYLAADVDREQFNFANASREQILSTFRKAGVQDIRLQHMDGCRCKGSVAEDWYAFIGRKADK